jgi:elongation factor G
VDDRNEAIHGLLFCHVDRGHGEDSPDLHGELNALLCEEPALCVRAGTRGDRLVLLGDDEVQIEQGCRRVQASCHVEIAAVQIAYLETIRRMAEADGKYIRQIGGSGNYAHCTLRLDPVAPDKGYEFVTEIEPSLIPKEYIGSIDQGVQSAMASGVLAGFPMVDVKVTLLGGSHHQVDSNEVSFRFAGAMAFREAARGANPVLLEPMMSVEATERAELIGEIVRDINSRRGRIEGIEPSTGSMTIRARVPLAEVLHSSLNGRPEYPMHFAGYEPLPSRGGFGDDAPAGVRNPSSPSSLSGSAAAELEG